MTQCHKIDYQLFGDDMQYVEVELDPGETVIAQASSLCYLEDGITMVTHLGDGSEPEPSLLAKLVGVGRKAISGEMLLTTHFTNHADDKRRVAFSAAVPGKVIAIDMQRVGGELVCRRDAFLCAAFGTQFTLAMQRRLGSGFFGGEGYTLQRLRGDGMAFIHTSGMCIKKSLEGATLRVEAGCLVSYTHDIHCEIAPAETGQPRLLGGDQLYLATLSGHGTVLLQSLPVPRLAERITDGTSSG